MLLADASNILLEFGAAIFFNLFNAFVFLDALIDSKPYPIVYISVPLFTNEFLVFVIVVSYPPSGSPSLKNITLLQKFLIK